MTLKAFLLTLCVSLCSFQVSASYSPVINPGLLPIAAFGNSIKPDKDPGPPADTGQHGDHKGNEELNLVIVQPKKELFL
ncbi:hypothetical protein [Acanthopleuribacter pedis]|uniref:Uncharacterized protein n=1 Tax=Acanthopleuribacter pedis TaxID=442870 RepID=A0A8J7U4N9_9BACT|nr:hypothetical protein [Acanthopleuribacter pedis]MBO1321678.1 hypothetical protein [Acanthopleuribacter pedis]